MFDWFVTDSHKGIKSLERLYLGFRSSKTMNRQQKSQSDDARVFVIVPAFNEAQNIKSVVTELMELQNDFASVVNRVIVCDNGSSDDTSIIAQNAGASVVYESTQGYGAACLRAISNLDTVGARNNDIIVFVDGDHSVKTSELPSLLSAYKSNSGLVIGARTASLIELGAMGPHQRVGNWMASKLINYFWGVSVSDLGPFRAISYRDLKKLGMRDKRFGWTTEMQVKAIQQKMRYTEVPVTTLKRNGVSKISGTLSGTIGAALGIFSTVFKLRIDELVRHRNRRLVAQQNLENSQ